MQLCNYNLEAIDPPSPGASGWLLSARLVTVSWEEGDKGMGGVGGG